MNIIRLHDFLGLEAPPVNGLAWHDLLVQGLPVSSLDAVAKYLEVQPSDVADLVLEGGSPQGQVLSAHASSFLYRIGKALRELEIATGGRLFEAAMWLRNPQPELRGRIPILLLQTPIGTDFVMAAIARMKPLPKEVPEYDAATSEEGETSRECE